MKRKIGIIGSGAWGTALAVAASNANNDVILWSRNNDVIDSINNFNENKIYLKDINIPKTIVATNDYQDVLNCDVILLVVPSQKLRDVCNDIKKHKPFSYIPFVICCKGIEQESLKLCSEIVRQIFPQNPIAVLSGPNFADEIANSLPAGTSIACEDEEVGKRLVEYMASPVFRPYYVDDIIGAQIGGAVKNVLAIACGICEGKKLGHNAKATLVTRGISEIAKLSLALGGNKQTLMFLCGIGDIMLTCGSIKSRNMSLGFELGQGKQLEDILKTRNYVTEGVTTSKSVFDLAKKLGLDLPICNAVYDIIYNNITVNQTITSLLHRPLTSE